ncbi:MAG: ribosome-associated translation inhibitor RaiA [Acidobacteriota bacterium]|jgi:putative sigma-54 modulation protein
MKFEFSGKNLTLTDALRSRMEKRISKLEKFAGHMVSAHASFEVEKPVHQVDLVIHCSQNRIYKARATAEDMYLAIHKATDAIEQQAKKDKTKRLAGRGKKKLAVAAAEAEAGEAEEEEPPSVRARADAPIQRNDLWRSKPMTVKDARLVLEEHDMPLVMFRELESDRVLVLFRQGRGQVAVVEPPVDT